MKKKVALQIENHDSTKGKREDFYAPEMHFVNDISEKDI
jgi:hypothetical protein